MKKLAILLFLSIIFTGCYSYISDTHMIPTNKYKFNYKWGMYMNSSYVDKITNMHKEGCTFIDESNEDTLTCIVSSIRWGYFTGTEIVKNAKYYNREIGTIYEYAEKEVTHYRPLLRARKNDSLSVHIYSTFNTSVEIHLADSIYTKAINIGDNVFYFNWNVFKSRINMIRIVNDTLYSMWLFYTYIEVDF